jgi:hypothetical protein
MFRRPSIDMTNPSGPPAALVLAEATARLSYRVLPDARRGLAG